MAVVLTVTYRTVRLSESSNTSVRHAQQVLSALIALEGATADLVFASSEQSIAQAAAHVSTNLDELSSLTADNAAQQRRLKELRAELGDVARCRLEPYRQKSRTITTLKKRVFSVRFPPPAPTTTFVHAIDVPRRLLENSRDFIELEESRRCPTSRSTPQVC